MATPRPDLALHNLTPGQHYREDEISPYHWVNGTPPTVEESSEFLACSTTTSGTGG